MMSSSFQESIAKALPVGWIVFVKVHPHSCLEKEKFAKGGRSSRVQVSWKVSDSARKQGGEERKEKEDKAKGKWFSNLLKNQLKIKLHWVRGTPETTVTVIVPPRRNTENQQ